MHHPICWRILPLVLALLCAACSPPEGETQPGTSPASPESTSALGQATEPVTEQAMPDRPRLVLQITVDQLRADLIERYAPVFGDGGFRYLIENGTVFENAHHDHANTETIVGHATIATGAHPSVHGMVGNLWFDRAEGRTVYNIEDGRYPLLSADAGVDQSREIDPTQRAARSEGRSPEAMLAPTIADAMFEAFGADSKRIAVSVKDRGAVSMAGHQGTAYWFSKAAGEFVTSRYYLDRYPTWVAEHNAARPTNAFDGEHWALGDDASRFRFGERDDQPWETDIAGFGRTFPHPYGDAGSAYFTTLLTLSPAGDRLVLDFAKQALIAEDLGTDDVPDYLSVSFSSTDYVGHIFGPSSLEAEVNLQAVDSALAELFAFVDEHVGLAHTLIVLSADHGAPDAPGYRNAAGLEGGYLNPSRWDSAAAIDRVKRRFDIDDELIERYEHPYIYFTSELRDQPADALRSLEQAVAEELESFEGIAMAVSASSLRDGRIPDGDLGQRVFNNYHPLRSGDVMVVFEPHFFINDFDGLTVAAHHGSPWEYDTHVPVMFAGPGITAERIEAPIRTVDIAPAIARRLGIAPPLKAVGKAPPALLP